MVLAFAGSITFRFKDIFILNAFVVVPVTTLPPILVTGCFQDI
jgi:pheromone shutdown protein TraB